MLSPEEIRWFQSAVNELNNQIQIAEESASFLATHCANVPDAKKYLDYLRYGLERASLVSDQISDRLKGVAEPPPAAPPPPPPPPAPALLPSDLNIEIENPGGSRELIMIVDDEPMITMLVSEMLCSAGYRVIRSVNPLRAFEIFQRIKSEIALVIVDFTMPMMNGDELFTEMRAVRRDIPVMLSSGFTEQATVRAMLAQGLNGFLPKPYTEEKLLSQVRSTLDAAQQQRAAAGR